VLPKLAYLTLCRTVQLLALFTRGDAAKDLEILVLRHQPTVLRRQVPRPRLQPADRALLAVISRALPRIRWSCFIVRPETLLRWHAASSPANSEACRGAGMITETRRPVRREGRWGR
jgi:putative transposase